MYEDTSTLINKGFDTWRTNLNIALPFILQGILSVVALLLLVASMLMLYLPTLEEIPNLQPEDIAALFTGDLLPLAGMLILILVVMTLISSFFTAGAVGMAQRATEMGSTGLDTMWSSGRRHYVSLFLATLIMMLILIAGTGLVMGLLAAVVLTTAGPVALDPQYLENLTSATAVAVILGVLLFIAFAILASLALALVPYALVVDGLGPMEAISRSVGFFRSNKFEVLMIWLIVIAISIALSLPGQLLGESPTTAAIWSLLSSAISLVVVAPLSTVWWTRLYMVRTEKEVDKPLEPGETVYL